MNFVGKKSVGLVKRYDITIADTPLVGDEDNLNSLPPKSGSEGHVVHGSNTLRGNREAELENMRNTQVLNRQPSDPPAKRRATEIAELFDARQLMQSGPIPRPGELFERSDERKALASGVPQSQRLSPTPGGPAMLAGLPGRLHPIYVSGVPRSTAGGGSGPGSRTRPRRESFSLSASPVPQSLRGEDSLAASPLASPPGTVRPGVASRYVVSRRLPVRPLLPCCSHSPSPPGSSLSSHYYPRRWRSWSSATGAASDWRRWTCTRPPSSSASSATTPSTPRPSCS